MKILSYIPDYRIEALNVSIEINTKEYIEIAKDIIDLNEFQRKKVINSKLKKTLSAHVGVITNMSSKKYLVKL